MLARYPLLAARRGVFAVRGRGRVAGLVGAQQADGPVALVIDDVQWADRRSVEALSFMFRRLSVDPVLVIVVVRGDRDSWMNLPGGCSSASISASEYRCRA